MRYIYYDMKTLSIQEACLALAIDQATLYRWLAQAGITPQTDTYDKRRRVLTQEQVSTLAQIHHRPLSSDLAAGATQSETAIRLAKQQKEMEELKRRVDELEIFVAEIIEALSAPPQEPQVFMPPREQATAHSTSTEPLVLDDSDSAPVQHLPRPATSRPVSTGAQVPRAGDTLPEGYTPLHEFLHGVPMNAAERSVQTFVKRGEWIHEGYVVKLALDAPGRVKAYEVLHNYPSFQPCPACPHIEPL